MREKECQNVSENIALIRLQQDKKAKEVLISTLEAQLQVKFSTTLHLIKHYTRGEAIIMMVNQIS